MDEAGHLLIELTNYLLFFEDFNCIVIANLPLNRSNIILKSDSLVINGERNLYLA